MKKEQKLNQLSNHQTQQQQFVNTQQNKQHQKKKSDFRPVQDHHTNNLSKRNNSSNKKISIHEPSFENNKKISKKPSKVIQNISSADPSSNDASSSSSFSEENSSRIDFQKSKHENTNQKSSETIGRSSTTEFPTSTSSISNRPLLTSNMEDTNNCVICLKSYTEKSMIAQCKHCFCLSCIQRWIQVRPTCPLCKATILTLLFDYDEKTNSYKKEENTPKKYLAFTHCNNSNDQEFMCLDRQYFLEEIQTVISNADIILNSVQLERERENCVKFRRKTKTLIQKKWEIVMGIKEDLLYIQRQMFEEGQPFNPNVTLEVLYSLQNLLFSKMDGSSDAGNASTSASSSSINNMEKILDSTGDGQICNDEGIEEQEDEEVEDYFYDLDELDYYSLEDDLDYWEDKDYRHNRFSYNNNHGSSHKK